jgi:predicted  nucleic acid-binding Zn-ribbon protein
MAVVCGKCGKSVEDSSPTDRTPCPNCGSVSRSYDDGVHEQANAEDHLLVKAKLKKGGKKVVRTEHDGEDLHRKTGRWSIVHRVLDKAADQYDEVIRDKETGTVIIEKHEPLTQHRSNSNPTPKGSKKEG